MNTVKILSLIFLSVYLIFGGLADFLGFHLSGLGALALGAAAVVSGVLILLSIHQYYHWKEE